MAIILKYCFWGDDEKRDAFIPLTDVKFIDTRKEMRGIAEDTVVSFNYRLVNIGQHDLRIGYINPDCTCTKCYAIDSVVVQILNGCTVLFPGILYDPNHAFRIFTGCVGK